MRIAMIAADRNSRMNENENSMVTSRLCVVDESRARYWHTLAGTVAATRVMNAQRGEIVTAAANAAMPGMIANHR